MKQTKEDMTGWIMSEHRVPDSRWNILERAEDYVSKSGYRYEMYLCERSYININGRQIHLGLFQNKEDAIKIRLKAEAKYYGEFAPQKHLFEQYKINIGGD